MVLIFSWRVHPSETDPSILILQGQVLDHVSLALTLAAHREGEAPTAGQIAARDNSTLHSLSWKTAKLSWAKESQFQAVEFSLVTSVLASLWTEKV